MENQHNSNNPGDPFEHSARFKRSQAVLLARVAMFTAAAVALGYLLTIVPNFELISATVALAGLTLGASSGFVVGGFAMLIYGGLNAWGLPYPPVWAAQITGMGLMGMTFGLLRSWLQQSPLKIQVIISGCFGLLLTFIYDSLTSLAFPLSAGLLHWHNWLAYFLLGLPFVVMHLVTNTLVFILLVPVVFQRLRRFSL